MKVRIQLEVEVSEIDFDGINIEIDHDSTEAWGRVAFTRTVECDWLSAKWNGIECEVIDDDKAATYLIEQSGEIVW